MTGAGFTFEVLGFKELDGALSEFAKSTGKGILARTLKKAAEPVRAAAEAAAPVLSGTLKASIITVVRRNLNKPGLVLAVIGPAMGSYRQLATPVAYVSKGVRKGKFRTYQIGGTPGVYGSFVEFGTSDTAPHPFLRPAWEANKAAALASMQTLLAAEIEKSRARAARKAAKRAGG